MIEIKDTNLQDLVKEASQELLTEMRRDGINKIKKLFTKIFVLTREIKIGEAKILEKKNSLTKTNNIIEKLKSGDWTALKDEKDNSENNYEEDNKE